MLVLLLSLLFNTDSYYHNRTMSMSLFTPTPTPTTFLLFFLLHIFILIHQTSSYSIEIASPEERCFIVTAGTGVPITGSFEIIHPDPKYIGVTVTGPRGYLHYEKKRQIEFEEMDIEDASEGFFSFDAEITGDYKMCIFNGRPDDHDGTERLVAFNYRAVPVGEQDYQFIGLQSEVSDLKEGLELLKDHQAYMGQREDMHKLTLESINVKVLCWTVLEAVILFAMALWQIIYIKSFFETKRRL